MLTRHSDTSTMAGPPAFGTGASVARAGGWSPGGGAAWSGGCSWTGAEEVDGAGVVAVVDGGASGAGVVPDGLGLAVGVPVGEAVPVGVASGVGLGDGDGVREDFGRALAGGRGAQLGGGGAGAVARGCRSGLASIIGSVTGSVTSAAPPVTVAAVRTRWFRAWWAPEARAPPAAPRTAKTAAGGGNQRLRARSSAVSWERSTAAIAASIALQSASASASWRIARSRFWRAFFFSS